MAEVKRTAKPVLAPVVGMASYSLIHRRGMASFLDRAIQAGFSGAIVPDLPVEEVIDAACKGSPDTAPLLLRMGGQPQSRGPLAGHGGNHGSVCYFTRATDACF